MRWINFDQTHASLLAGWAKARISFPGDWQAPYFTIALMDDLAPLAVCLYTGYNTVDLSCYMHIAAVPGRRWLTRPFLRAVFEHPFIHSKCRRVSGIVKAKNSEALAFDKHIGFVEEGRLRKAAYDGDDYVVLGMLKEECRWIGTHAKRLHIAHAA